MKDTQRVILIVDDEENDSYLLESTFKQVDRDLTIKTVNSGEEALAYLDGQGEFGDRKRFPFPTLLFVDLKMSGMDGFCVLQHVKKNPKSGIIPSVVFSASSDLDDNQESVSLRRLRLSREARLCPGTREALPGVPGLLGDKRNTADRRSRRTVDHRERREAGRANPATLIAGRRRARVIERLATSRQTGKR